MVGVVNIRHFASIRFIPPLAVSFALESVAFGALSPKLIGTRALLTANEVLLCSEVPGFRAPHAVKGACRTLLGNLHILAKLSDAEGEACECQVWIELARRCRDMEDEVCEKLGHCLEKMESSPIRGKKKAEQ